MRRDGTSDGQEDAAPGLAGEASASPAIDPGWLSGIIGAIYDCVLYPENWRGVIGAVAAEFGFADSLLALGQFSPAVHNLVVTHGLDDDWLSTTRGIWR